MNNVIYFYRQISSDLKHKGNLVSLLVQTANFWTVANTKQVGKSFGNKTAQKLNRIENNPLDVIVTLLTIYLEVIPSMIDVVLINPWEMFKMLCTGMAVAGFNDTLFKASGKTFEFIQADFNKKICLADKISE